PREQKIETGVDTIQLHAAARGFDHTSININEVQWTVRQPFPSLVSLTSNKEDQCIVTPGNNTNETAIAYVSATTSFGLQAVSVINVLPKILPAPVFKVKPYLKETRKGQLTI